jgi:hypothetical protein
MTKKTARQYWKILKDRSNFTPVETRLAKEVIDILNKDKKISERIPKRETGEHLFVSCGGFPKCATCGADEDTAFVGGEECTYEK